jgi:aminoglycoside/choline kinase family phosphotransferase
MWLKGGFIRHDFTFDDSFVREAQFFAGWGRDLEINIPKGYWADWEDGVQGLVLLEDLAARNVTFGYAPIPMTVDQQAATLHLLAKMHARWWESTDLKALPNFSTAWQSADRVVMMMLEKEHFEKCMALPRCKEHTGDYRDPDKIKAGLRAQWKQAPDIPQCFNHGDAHLGNMYFETDGSPGFLDWQSWQEGPYMHDVAYSIIGGLTMEDRRAHEKDMLAIYLDKLKEYGVKAPPSREDAWEAYRRHAMHGFMWAFTPTEMQPEEICEVEGWRFGVAVRDLDTFGALGI